MSTKLPSNALLWFGVLGGAGAWTVQFLANLFLTYAQCNQPTARWMVDVHTWEVVLSIAAIGVGLAAWAVTGTIYLRTARIDDVSTEERHGEGSEPPLGRVHFLAMIGLLVNFLALSIIVMTGIGAPLLPVCQQS